MSDLLTGPNRQEILLTAIPLLPLVGGLVLLAVSRTRLASAGRGIALGVLVAVLSCAALLLVELTAGATGQIGIAWEWMRIPGGVAGFHLVTEMPTDARFVVLFLAVGTAATVIAASMAPSPGAGDVCVPAAGILLAVFASVFVCFAGDMLTLFIFWQLSGLLGSVCMLRRDDDGRDAAIARKTLLYGLCSDIPLWIGVLWIWTKLGTFHSDVVVTMAGTPGALSDDQAAALTAMGWLLLVGVAGRCWQLPFLDLAGDAARLRGRFAMSVQQFLVMPLGVVLVLRCEPLFSRMDGAGLWVSMLGGISGLAAAVCAATSRHRSGSSMRTSVALYGLMLIGVGTGTAAGLTGAIVLFVVHQLAAPVWIAEFASGRNVVTWPAVAVLAAGLAGQNRILTAVLPSAANADRAPWISYSLSLLVVAIVLLVAFALARMLRRHQTETPDRDPSAVTSTLHLPAAVLGTVSAILFVVLVATVVPGVDEVLSARPEASSGVAPQAVAAEGWATLICLTAAAVGGLAGWTTGAGSAWLERLAGPARHGFYLDDMWDLAVVQPIRAVAQLVRFAEWFLIDRFLAGLPRRIPQLLMRGAAPVRTETFSFYAMSVLLATAVLLAVLAWPGG